MKNPSVIDQEVALKPIEIFFSITDSRGVVQTGNETFIRVSGFSRDEIIGKPHSIVRHPDMPRGIFYIFWKTIQSGQPISAFVKNRTKDGRYYWVMASVIPIPNGYLSVRFRPTQAFRGQVQGLYRKLVEAEASLKPDQSAALALDELKKLGHKDYLSFAGTAISAELEELFKDPEVSGLNCQDVDQYGEDNKFVHLYRDSVRTDKEFEDIYAILKPLADFEKNIEANVTTIISLSQQIKLLSTNASVLANRIGNAGVSLAVVATESQAVAERVRDHVEGMIEVSKRLLTETNQVKYLISISRIQIKMLVKFVLEILADQENDNAEKTANCEVISHSLKKSTKEAFELISRLSEKIRELKSLLGDINDETRMLEMIRNTGRVEAARLEGGGAEFEIIFDQIIEAVNKANGLLSEFNALESVLSESIKKAVVLS